MKNQSTRHSAAITLSTCMFIAFGLLSAGICLAQPDPQYRIHEWNRPRPPVVDPGIPSTQEQAGKAPSDAVVLFDGKDLNSWSAINGSPTRWIIKDGIMECVAGSGMIRTLQSFGDCQLHLEWAAPVPPRGRSQGRGNSGVFLMGIYEVQVLDNFENETYADGYAASIYGQYPPLVNAARPPGQWQTYDILFSRPRLDDKGQILSPARLTVLHNGVLVQNNVAPTGPTGWMDRAPYQRHADKLPLSLQDHGNPVRYRNIWIRELGSDAGQKEYSFSTELLDKYIGLYRATPRLSIEILRRGTQMYMKRISDGSEREFALHAESKTRFYSKEVDTYVSFQTNDQGLAESLSFYMGGDTTQAKKVK